jgi:hypothetical protein
MFASTTVKAPKWQKEDLFALPINGTAGQTVHAPARQ